MTFPAVSNGSLSLGVLKQAVTDALNTDVTIPAGHRGAVVTFLNGDHVQVALATRLLDDVGGHVTWDVEGTVAKTYDGPWSVGVLNKVTF